MTTKVLIVDDSIFVRNILTSKLSEDPDIEVVAAVDDAYSARDAIVNLEPDVITLDVRMPKMDGVEFLQKLMPQFPIPVVMVSAYTQAGKDTTLKALEAGAIDFVPKPSSLGGTSLDNMIIELRTKIKIAAKADVSHWKEKWNWRKIAAHRPPSLEGFEKKVIVIGASTGGTDAIRRVICQLPRTTPGIVIVQHMPPGFTQLYADRLNQQAQMLVKEASDGDKVRPGQVLIAPGGKQMRLRPLPAGRYAVSCREESLVCGHQPSVEVLMQSAARCVGPNAVGVMLTGMGADGAQGMLAMRQAGARTIAQDQQSSVVFGMPREAHRVGAVEELLPLSEIADAIMLRIESIKVQKVI